MATVQTDRQVLIEQYARGPARLREALAKLPEAALKWRPAEGAWSAHEVVCHCADAETSSYLRIRYLVAEREPLIVGYDQEGWARVFDYHSLPLEPALAQVEIVRAATSRLIRGLPDAAWRRAGRHTESGAYSADDWLRIYAEHLEIHAQQIEANLAAWEKAGRPTA
jgi:hypothetical protein